MPTFQYDDPATKSLSEATRTAIVNHIQDLVEQFSIDKYPSENREHLGASVIGHPCSRKIWYDFHWCKLEQFDGRMRRLFSRGHYEEPRFIEMLRAIGFNVVEVDPDTGKQFRIYGVHGHFGGSGDSKAIMPWLPDLPILLEFKTHNQRSFLQLVEKKLMLSKPQHYTQMCMYGKGYGYKYGLYCAVNKNDDDIYFELVELNWNHSLQSENKAADIITAKFPPQKISDNPAYFECKFCDKRGICHYNEPVEINCRSCKMSSPIENAEWFCSRFNAIIPKDFIAKGCPDHVSINI